MAKSNQLTAAFPTVDPRERMKEVRAEVRMYVEGGTNPWGIPHIGHLYGNPEDMARAMIALHDMYDARAQKHNKASTHIADLLADNDRISQAYYEALNTAEFFNTAGQQLRILYDQTISENKKLKYDLAIQDRKLEAALVTISTIMEG